MDNQGCCKPDNSCSTTGGGSCGPSGGCCWSTLIKGAIVGGIVLFAWCWISWTMLPWHKTTMMSFANEKAVATVLGKEAEKSGIYVLPKMSDTATEAVKPYAFVSVVKDGIDWKTAKNPAMIKKGIVCLIVAFFLTCLLKKTSSGCCTIKAAGKVGVIAALLAHAPNMIWFGFPLEYSLVGMADTLISVTLAGFFISKFVLGSGSCSK